MKENGIRENIENKTKCTVIEMFTMHTVSPEGNLGSEPK